MKNIIGKIRYMLIMLPFMLSIGQITSFAGDYGNPENMEGALATIRDNVIIPYLKPVGGIFIFIAVLSVGWTIIYKRNNPEERSASMTGLIYITAGAFILGCIAIIYGMFIGQINHPLDEDSTFSFSEPPGLVYDETTSTHDASGDTKGGVGRTIDQDDSNAGNTSVD